MVSLILLATFGTGLAIGYVLATRVEAPARTTAVTGDIDRALTYADIAVGLAPDAGNVLDFHAWPMLCTGSFEAARTAADTTHPRDPSLGPYANLSFFGAESFHLGLYEDATFAFLKATFAGDPISALTLAYRAAAYQAQGNTKDARRYIRELRSSWPKFRADEVLERLYGDPAQARYVQDRFRDAGWSDFVAPSPAPLDAD